MTGRLVEEGDGGLRLRVGLKLRLGLGLGLRVALGEGGILTFKDKAFEPIVLCTVSSLEILPALPRKSMVAWIGPAAPGANVHG